MSAINSIAKLKKELLNDLDNIIYSQMVKIAKSAIEDAFNNKEYRNLTGNTVTSLSAGLYKEKKLFAVLNVREILGIKDPTRPTISGTGSFYEFNLYDSGAKKKLYGRVLADNFIETSEEFGYERAMRLLQNYKVESDYAIVICTGTEYSSYLEDTKRLNVLTETGQNLETIFLHNKI